jgi:hypothetical protein
MKRHRAERLVIVARCAKALFKVQDTITSEELTNRVCRDAEWCDDGYKGAHPYSRAHPYVLAYLQDERKAGRILIDYQGSSHYNSDGTFVTYSRVEQKKE